MSNKSIREVIKIAKSCDSFGDYKLADKFSSLLENYRYAQGQLLTLDNFVDSFFSKILKRDPRVKKFPFVINTLPTSKGLIPKIAKVLPFNMFVYNFNFFNTNNEI